MNYETGSKGFIGSSLAKKLDIVAIPHEDISRIKLQPFKNFFFCSSYGNLASHTDEDAMYKANVIDLINILGQCKNIDFDSFIFLSTSSVKLRFQTTYSRLKRAAEEILLAHMERHNKQICIIRPYSVTGVGEQEEHLIPTLIRAAYSGETINFVPSPVHDYIDVEDVADGILNLSKNQARGIFELGTGKGYTNQEVLDIVEQETGKRIKVNIVNNMRPYDNDSWVSSNFKSRGYGWTPKVDLQTSIRNMVAEYRKGRELN